MNQKDSTKSSRGLSASSDRVELPRDHWAVLGDFEVTNIVLVLDFDPAILSRQTLSLSCR